MTMPHPGKGNKPLHDLRIERVKGVFKVRKIPFNSLFQSFTGRNFAVFYAFCVLMPGGQVRPLPLFPVDFCDGLPGQNPAKKPF